MNEETFTFCPKCHKRMTEEEENLPIWRMRK